MFEGKKKSDQESNQSIGDLIKDFIADSRDEASEFLAFRRFIVHNLSTHIKESS